MRSVTHEQFRRLAEIRSEHGNVLSMYVDLDPQHVPTPAARHVEVDSLLAEARHRMNDARLPRQARRTLKADIEHVATFITHQFTERHAHGLAVFCASDARVFEAVKLPRGIGPAVRVGDCAYIEPLLRFVDEPTWCVLLVNRRTCRILVGDEHGFDRVAAQADDAPGRHEQGGWAQARYQRHVDVHIADHVKRAAGLLNERFKREPFSHLLVGCPDDVWSQVQKALHRELSDRLVGRIEVDVEHSSPESVLSATRPIIEQAKRVRGRELIARAEQDLASGRAVAGDRDAIGALVARRASALIVATGPASPGIEHAVHLAAEQGIGLHTLTHDDDVPSPSSLVALLRY